MAKRKPIPQDIRNQVLVDAMGRCCLCPEHHDVVDLHHVVLISEGGPNTAENLMAVCPTCHAKIHRIRNSYPVEQLRMYKERWVKLCALGLPLDVRIAQAFDVTRPPTPPQMPPGIPAPPSPYIAHPYPAQAHFTGRDAERKALIAWLAGDAHPLLALIAIGGMGKSALAWHWVQHDVPGGEPPLDGILWWSFYDRESGFERFLERGVAYASGGETDATGWPVRDRMECLCRLLREKRFLLVLDGFERLLRAYARMDAPYLADDVGGVGEQLQQCADPNVGTSLQWLAGPGATKTLLTSRLFPQELEGLAGVKRVDLTQMDPDDAVRFFQALEIQGTRAEIQAACAPYGYLPLALRLLGGLVAEDPARPGDIAVATEYEVTEDLRGKEHHHILERAYAALSDEARGLLSRIAAFRAPVGYGVLQALFGPHPSPAALRQAQGGKGWGESFRFPTERALKDALRGLLNRGLLSRQEGTGHYDLHPVVRRYAYERLGDKEGTHTRLRDYFAAVPGPEKIESLDDLAPVIELCHHTVRAGQYDEAEQLFYDRLVQLTYYRFGAYQLCIELLRALFPGGEPLAPSGEAVLPLLSDESAQAWTLNALANSYALSGQPGRAVPVFGAAAALAEKQGNKRNVAISLGNLADMAQLLIGALAAAEEALRRSIALCREIGDEGDEATGQYSLGRVLSYEGQFEEAEEQFCAAFDAKQEHRQAQGIILAHRALRALLMGDADGALEAARRARELADVQSCEADIIRAEWLLGAALRARGELDQAEPHLEEALRRCRRINMVDHEPDILLELARLRRDQAVGARRDAPLREETLSLAKEALAIADRCGYRLKQADCHNFLARLAVEEGDLDEAREHAQTARERAECDGPPHRYEVAFQEAERLLAEIASRA
jgi:tetratricopeptide (TPR) repeat protein